MIATARHIPRRGTRLRRAVPRGVGLIGALCLVMTMVVPAGATIVESGRFVDTFTDSYDDCGFPIQVEGAARGQYWIRAGTGDLAGVFFLHSNVTFEEVHTANGKTYTLRGHRAYNEMRAEVIDGSIVQLTSIEAGQPFAIYDEGGNLVLRDRGVIQITYLFDTQGDDVPGGEFVELLDVRLAGPHPGFVMDFAEICALFE